MPGRPLPVLRSTLGLISAIASIALRIPLPTAVRRPVVRLAIPSITTPRSTVGAWITAANPLNATNPIRVPAACCETKSMAARCAASRRLGSMSDAHMLRETSRASTIVRSAVGTATTAVGRAIASTSAAIAATKSANGTWRRQRALPGRAAWMRLRLE